jgi:uncharacterized protein YggE
MKKNLLFAAFSIAGFFTAPAWSQTAGNALYNGNGTMIAPPRMPGVDLGLVTGSYSFGNILEANVMMNVKPTAYVAIFSITQHGNTIEEAEAAMRDRVQAFKTQLQQDRSEAGQVFTDPVSLVPEYETEVTEKRFSRTLNEVPKGFEIKKNVHITFHVHDQINQLIASAAKAEVYDLVKVEYAVDDLAVVLSTLRQEAMHILLEKKSAMEQAGLFTRFVQVGERYGSVYPFERYAQYYAYKTGVTPGFAGQVKKGQQVQYNYAEKNKTIYYEKVADSQFDKVINPVVGEPEVQVYLTLKGQFAIFDPQTEKTQKAYEEKLRQLELRERELILEEKKKDIELKGRKLAK